MNDREGLSQIVDRLLGLHLTSRQLEAFAWYASELITWNERFNLTAITDPIEIEVKHFLDSLTCLQLADFRSGDRVVDVGTGAGLPGLVLKIACPGIELTLVESIQKKVHFCRHVVDGLQLEGVQVIHTRAERVGQDPEHRGRYTWALARAVASTPILLEYLLPLLQLQGCALLYKGMTGPSEVHEARNALAVLGGEVLQILPVELPKVSETRHLILVRKCAATPAKYPRRTGIPTKRPL
jgi:16S rRNA (guanine527-N7)-methyltransferase